MPTPTLPQKPDIPTPPATPAPPAPVQEGPAAMQVLVAQYQALTQQLAGLRAQKRVLQRQVNSGQPVVAAEAQAKLLTVDGEIARVSVELEGVRGQMGARIGQPGERGLPPDFPNNPRPRSGMDSGDVTGICITFILAVLMPISIGITRRILRRPSKDTTAPDVIAPRLDRLEQAVDAIAIEVERIAEGQRFVTKVMTERPAVAPTRNTPNPDGTSASALGDAKPFLALGAGPIEPIRVAERQAVRQSITPH